MSDHRHQSADSAPTHAAHPQLQRPPAFYLAIRGAHAPAEYGRIARVAEELGFDRIYLYDDLMHHPAWPALSLMAQTTRTIELGPCLVNGFYVHPAVLAANVAFLDQVSDGRAVLGVGRGAFFDFVGLDDSEVTTREACEETVKLISRCLAQDPTPFRGRHFSANEHAVLRNPVLRSRVPTVLASWNPKMAHLAGRLAVELQIAEAWRTDFLEELYAAWQAGRAEGAAGEDGVVPRSLGRFSVGGMVCLSDDVAQARETGRRTLAVYLPYLRTILQRYGMGEHPCFEHIVSASKRGDFDTAARLIPDEMVNELTMVGTPADMVDRLLNIASRVPFSGVIVGPPYGTSPSLDENLERLAERVLAPVRARWAPRP